MTRFLQTSQQALSEQSLTAFRQLADIGVTSGAVYFCTGAQWIYYNANTYVPVGGLGEISAIEEESDVFPRDVTLRLCGVNTMTANGSSSIYEPLRESMAGRPVTIRRVFLDVGSAMALTSSAELQWRGTVGGVKVDIERGEWELRAVNEWRRGSKVQLINRETFRAVDSSDTFGDWIDQIPLFRGDWGGNKVGFSGGIMNAPSTGNAKTDALNKARTT